MPAILPADHPRPRRLLPRPLSRASCRGTSTSPIPSQASLPPHPDCSEMEDNNNSTFSNSESTDDGEEWTVAGKWKRTNKATLTTVAIVSLTRSTTPFRDLFQQNVAQSSTSMKTKSRGCSQPCESTAFTPRHGDVLCHSTNHHNIYATTMTLQVRLQHYSYEYYIYDLFFPLMLYLYG